MSGSKNGFVKTSMVGYSVSATEKNPLRYTPAHTKADGTFVSARLEIPVMVNEYGSKEPDSYKLVAWGGRADMFAKALSQGKEMNFHLTSSSYFRKIYNNQNGIINNSDGTPVMVRSMSFTIRDFTWGADSERQVGLEIAAQVRGIGWNDPTSPDYIAWRKKIEDRKNLFYNGGPTFGYAKVENVPAGCTVLLGDQSRNARNKTGAVASTPTLVSQVAAALDPITGFPVAQAQPAAAAHAGV